MFKNKFITVPLLLSCLLFSLSLAAEPLNVGVILDLSGEAAEMGQKALNGMRVAQKSLPEGSVNLFYEDTAGMAPKNAITAYGRLTSKNKIDVIVGPWGPDQAQALSPAAKKQGDALFAFSMCVDEFKPLSNVVCTYPSTADQVGLVQQLAAKIGIKSMSLILEDSVFAHSVIPILESQQRAGSYQIKSRDFFPPDGLDFNSLASKVISKEPDTIFIAHGSTAKALSLVKSLREKNFSGRLVAYIDIDEKYLKEYGSVLEGLYLPGFTSPVFEENFTNSYKAMFGETPSIIYSAQGYDIIRGLASRQASTGNKDKSNLLNGLENILDGKGAIAGYKLRADRTSILPLEVWQIKDGRFATILKSNIEP